MRLFSILLVLFSSNALAASEPVYKNPRLPVEARVEDALSRLTLEEKIGFLSGDESGFASRGNARLGIPSIQMTDGPVGVRMGQATAFPAGIAMAATFDPLLVSEAARAMAVETRAVGRDMLLGPCINIVRQPLGGRNFESFGEDPFLTAQITRGYLQGVQGQGVIASTKHFALNNQEHKRTEIDVIADERTMEEIYFPGFHAAVEAGTWSVMSSYNKLNGAYASENAYLLNDTLKKRWGFRGFVISDWGATHSTVASALNGLDLEMPSGAYFGEKLLAAVRSREVPERLINDKVRRILRAIFGSGLFDSVRRPHPSVISSPAHLTIASRMAASSLVLLKNEDHALPLRNSRSVAVLGASARHARLGGGGSSVVNPTWVTTPLEALRRSAPGVQWNFAEGARMRRDFDSIPTSLWTTERGRAGVTGEYFNNPNLGGTPTLTRVDPGVDFDWVWNTPGPGIGGANFSVRWTGYFHPENSGNIILTVRHDDGARLWVNDQLVLDAWQDQEETISRVPLKAETGKSYKIRLEYYQHGGSAMAGLGIEEARGAELEEAVALAAKSDTAVIFAGLSRFYEGEELDRTTLSLPEGQDELIGRVADVNPNTIVVIQAGNPVSMPWLAKVKAVVFAWYGGQEGSRALADVLLGKVNPSGKLPVSFPVEWRDSPAFGHFPEDQDQPDRVTYSEGIFVGYRHFDRAGPAPLFPFGYGLSYSSFAFKNLSVRLVDKSAKHPRVEVFFDLTNTGTRTGAEVAQLYVSELSPSVERPVKELKGFTKVPLRPGETRRVSLTLDRSAFAFYDTNQHAWNAKPGAFTLRVGSSSRDLPLEASLQLE
ncbi:MAG TPA: glycoside hydrolase family 3 C-terminal domain-containing protein [Bdellovibrionota bacterium]|jgi:beta-glucosidase